MRHNATLTRMREEGLDNSAYLMEEERYTSLAARASRKLNRDLRAAMRDGVIDEREQRLITEETMRAAHASGPQRLTAIA